MIRGTHIQAITEPEPEYTGPNVQPHPLAVAQGVNNHQRYPDCETCPVRAACIQAVCRLQPFVRPECNAALSKRKLGLRQGTIQERILQYIAAHPGTTRAQLRAAYDDIDQSIANCLARLTVAGKIEAVRIGPRTNAYYATE